jgi:hypothetical protein
MTGMSSICAPGSVADDQRTVLVALANRGDPDRRSPTPTKARDFRAVLSQVRLLAHWQPDGTLPRVWHGKQPEQVPRGDGV